MEGLLRLPPHRWGPISPSHPKFSGADRRDQDVEGGRVYSCCISDNFTFQKRDAPSSLCLSGNGGVMATQPLGALALILMALLCLNL